MRLRKNFYTSTIIIVNIYVKLQLKTIKLGNLNKKITQINGLYKSIQQRLVMSAYEPQAHIIGQTHMRASDKIMVQNEIKIIF